MGWKDNYRYWRITSGRYDAGKEGAIVYMKLRSKALMVLLLIVIFAFIGASVGIFIAIIDTTKELSTDDLQFKNLTTVFLDRNGKEAGVIYGDQNRTTVRLNEMSKYLPDAFISIEDERFKQHHGIDIKRTIGAVINYLIPGGKQYGGSTITQQLVKNLTGDDDVTPKRKIQEQWRALQLENKLSKEQILELYLNTIYLDEGAYGVQTASRVYFDKDASELTLAESALIAGITQYPRRYNPLRNLKASKDRQEVVLAKMKELGCITEQEYSEAVKQEIKLKKGTVVKREESQSYFIDAVCEDVLADLQKKKNISKVIAQKMLFSDGLKVYTTMDSDIQTALNEAYSDNSKVFARYKGKSIKPQSAMVVIDYKTGQVAGLVGGRGKKSGILTFNRATHAKRQPGSSIKPIAVYAPALNEGIITSATVIDDVPISIRLPDGKLWSPRNWYKEGFWGLSTIRRGIENSMNIVAVKTWLKVGGDRSYDFLKELGLSSLTESDKNSPAALALGGLTNGVSPMEMASAYGAIANGGYYIKPITYTRVEDKNGNVILKNTVDSKNVMDERAAFILTNMMQDVVASTGTAAGAKLSNMPVAGKTGTTSNNYDRWFVGFTPYYVGATWFGYDEPQKISGDNYSIQLWKAVMQKAHKNKPSKDFAEPSGIVRQEICIDSGKKPCDLCRNDPRGNRTRVEIFIKGTEPTETCTTHVRVCKASNLIAGDACPPETTKVGIVRQESYAPADSNAPMPKDRPYEVPVNRYCNMH